MSNGKNKPPEPSAPTPPAPPAPAPTGRIVLCPGDDCDAEVNLDESDEDGDVICPKCGLDVGWVIEKDRRDRAGERLRKRREEEQQNIKEEEKKKSKKKFFSFEQ